MFVAWGVQMEGLSGAAILLAFHKAGKWQLAQECLDLAEAGHASKKVCKTILIVFMYLL